KMKSLSGFLLLLSIALAILRSVQAQDQSGFISLDCGLNPKEATYTDDKTNITYISDADYIDSGLIGRIDEPYQTQSPQQTWTLRSFPEGQRNCYNFNLKANSKYLIRGSFVYGNYDGLNQIPRFDLHVGPNKWTSVVLEGVGNTKICEIIHVLAQDRLQVCLVKTGRTTPFISLLELRPLNNNSYVTQSGSLMTFNRIYFPHTDPSRKFLRYDEDFHDRIWYPLQLNNTVSLSTDLLVDTNSNPYDVPQNVVKTAVAPAKATLPLHIWWTLGDISAQSYIYMHFAEIQNLGSQQIRQFNISYNGDQVWEDLCRPHKLNITTSFNSKALSSSDGKFNFTFTKTEDSTLPPLINAIEVYTVVENLLLETYQDEASGLSGAITPDIANLIQLRELDLSKNDLSGEIPAFLADMKMLTLINLSGNPKLNLTIPDSLQQRIKNRSLTLITDEKSGRKFALVAVAYSVAALIALLAIFTICYIVAKKKRKSTRDFYI
ncbi:unnamed protein product, partial [Thlaspi arvense]